MREIEFRAWRKDEKKMIDVKAIDWDEDGNIFSVNYPEGKSYSGYDSDNIELMQYTGRIDKNGKKIFDKDVVKLKGYLWEVYWSDEESCFKIKNKFDDLFLTKFKEKALEVVGNIYENKELLETFTKTRSC